VQGTRETECESLRQILSENEIKGNKPQYLEWNIHNNKST
jgi:hypothetical protein